MNVDGKMAFVFTSPRLHNDDDARILRECPVGAVLKNAPHVYDVLGVWRYSDNAGMAIQSQPKWLREAFRVIDAEKSRLTELSKQDNQSKRDAAFARRAVKGAQ